ncbi:MAG: hypothetical protein IKY67_06255 [Paludibacteraceae bacterium]|nr:hypothetical protein [Paludibacteraceae bacterium]
MAKKINNKFYSVEKEINGVKYVAQFNGLSAALKAVDDSYIDGSDNISMLKLSEYVFKHVIVEPKGLDVDDFESLDDFTEVMNWAQGVMQGQFRPTAE